MNGKIKNSNYSTVVEPSIDLTLHYNNFKKLTPEDASEHLLSLKSYLEHMVVLISRKLKTEFSNCEDQLLFSKEIVKTLQLFILKNRIAGMADSDEPALSCSIDPSHSGFPIFLRDFRFLANDKSRAEEELAKIKPDKNLVDDALFSIFKGVYPEDTVLDKLKKNYYEKILNVEIFDEYIKYTSENKQDGGDYYIKQAICRLNGDDNLPQVYTFYFKIPSEVYRKNIWKEKFDQAVEAGFNTVSDLELSHLANQIGEISEIDLHMIERFTIGPFYSRFTENTHGIENLFLDSENEDGMLLFVKQTVNKTGENKKRTMLFFKKKRISNNFSPVIESPRYALLPHRFIQKVHIESTGLSGNIKMFGITSKGEVVD